MVAVAVEVEVVVEAVEVLAVVVVVEVAEAVEDLEVVTVVVEVVEVVEEEDVEDPVVVDLKEEKQLLLNHIVTTEYSLLVEKKML